jgi:hypothetical protein
MRHVMVITLMLIVGASAHAVLTTEQLDVLVTNMQVRTEQSVIDAVTANDAAWLMDFYNSPAAPEYHVWDETVTPEQYKGAIHWNEFDAIGGGKRSSFEMLTGAGTLTLNAAFVNVRGGINDIFSGTAQAQTLADMLPLLRRYATEWERLQVGEVGTDPGSYSNPGTAIWPGQLALQDIQDALALIP